MSGGHFDYQQYKIGIIGASIEQLIWNNNSKEVDEWSDHVGRCYTEETISEFRIALKLLRRAEIYAQRIDYLASGDDGEESFHKRLALELAEEADNV
jgi:hypothetical protein